MSKRRRAHSGLSLFVQKWSAGTATMRFAKVNAGGVCLHHLAKRSSSTLRPCIYVIPLIFTGRRIQAEMLVLYTHHNAMSKGLPSTSSLAL